MIWCHPLIPRFGEAQRQSNTAVFFCPFSQTTMETSVLLWDENKVNKWIASIGFSAYERQFKGRSKNGEEGL